MKARKLTQEKADRINREIETKEWIRLANFRDHNAPHPISPPVVRRLRIVIDDTGRGQLVDIDARGGFCCFIEGFTSSRER